MNKKQRSAQQDLDAATSLLNLHHDKSNGTGRNKGKSTRLVSYDSQRKIGLTSTVRHQTNSNHRGDSLTCKYCGKKFKHASSKSTHEIDQHKNAQGLLYVCIRCRKPMSSANALRRHAKTFHANNEEICCLKCPFVAASKEELKTHKWDAHQKCEYCGNRYERLDTHKPTCRTRQRDGR